jgi:cyclomaltodextrinase / maltogenic alpha-amylase / neopullulanase
MRRTQRALTHGAVVWLDNDQPDAVLSFLRRTSDQEILSVVNLSNRALDVRIAVPEAASWPHDTLIADGVQAAEDDGRLRLALDGLGYLVAKRQEPTKGS